MITVVDYGAGNLGSVVKAFKYLGVDTKIARTAADIASAKALVLPGVGAFGDCMLKLEKNGFDRAVIDYIKENRPFLGICLGFQMLFDYSEEGNEGDNIKGLSVFPGCVRLFSQDKARDKGLKIPQIGWNNISVASESETNEIQKKSRLFKDINSGEYFYFVHSYYVDAEDESIVVAKCEYVSNFVAAVECGNIFATQFHPEKSGEAGLKVLKNFIDIIGEPAL